MTILLLRVIKDKFKYAKRMQHTLTGGILLSSELGSVLFHMYPLSKKIFEYRMSNLSMTLKY